MEIIKSKSLTVSSELFENALGVILLRNVHSSPFSIHRSQFITQPSSQANLSGSVSNRHSLVSPTLGRHLHSCLRCEIVSIHPTQAYMWAMNNISRCGTVWHLLLPLISCPRGITGSLSPLPEPRSWACKGVLELNNIVQNASP